MGVCGQGDPPLPPRWGRGYGRGNSPSPRVPAACGNRGKLFYFGKGHRVPRPFCNPWRWQPSHRPSTSQPGAHPAACPLPPSPVPTAPLVPYGVPPSPLLCPAVGPSATLRCVGAAGPVQGARPGFGAGPLWSCWDARGRCRAPGAEGDGGHSAPRSLFSALASSSRADTALGAAAQGVTRALRPQVAPQIPVVGHESFPTPPHASRDPISQKWAPHILLGETGGGNRHRRQQWQEQGERGRGWSPAQPPCGCGTAGAVLSQNGAPSPRGCPGEAAQGHWSPWEMQ